MSFPFHSVVFLLTPLHTIAENLKSQRITLYYVNGDHLEKSSSATQLYHALSAILLLHLHMSVQPAGLMVQNMLSITPINVAWNAFHVSS